MKKGKNLRKCQDMDKFTTYMNVLYYTGTFYVVLAVLSTIFAGKLLSFQENHCEPRIYSLACSTGVAFLLQFAILPIVHSEIKYTLTPSILRRSICSCIHDEACMC